MIDWSSSDYTRNESNLFYIPDIEGGVYMSKKDNLDEHLCYKCSDNTKKIILSEEFTQPKQVPQSQMHQPSPVQSQSQMPMPSSMQPPQVHYIPYPMPMQQMPTTIPLQQPPMPSMPIKSNFSIGLLSSPDSFILFIFITLVLFMVFIELRISNIYRNLKNQYRKENRNESF